MINRGRSKTNEGPRIKSQMKCDNNLNKNNREYTINNLNEPSNNSVNI